MPNFFIPITSTVRAAKFRALRYLAPSRLTALLAPLLTATLMLPATPAQALDGDCAITEFAGNYIDYDGQTIFDDYARHASVIEMDIPVYSDETIEQASDKILRFGTVVRVLDPGSGDRIEVGDAQTRQPVGWVDRTHLFCKIFPMAAEETGLWRRTYVQTATAQVGQVEKKKIYESTGGECRGGEDNCLEVSRFAWFFVYAEKDGMLLISEQANLADPIYKLRGWMKKEDGIEWNTATALRPKEELELLPGPREGDAESYVCAYRSLEELRARKNPDQLDEFGVSRRCRPMLGGARWYGSKRRLPVIGEIENPANPDEIEAYEVAFTASGSTGDEQQTLDLILGRDRSGNTQELSSLDVFFVIDGSNSMGSVIQAIKGEGDNGLVAQLDRQLRAKIGRGASYRVGFRVYRDSTAGQSDDGVRSAEHYALPGDCEQNTEETFEDAFARVKAADLKADGDFPENVFGGLNQARLDSGCPGRLKLFIVIGDHGYDANAQKQRGHTSLSPQALAARFGYGEDEDIQNPPIIMFVQMPKDLDGVTNTAGYNDAYQDFEDQAKDLIGRIVTGSRAANAGNELFHRLSAAQLQAGNRAAAVADLVEKIDAYIRPDLVDEISDRIALGQPVIEAIEQMSQQNEGVPMVLWDVLEGAFCAQLGTLRCNESLVEEVGLLYIPNSPADWFRALGSRVPGLPAPETGRVPTEIWEEFSRTGLLEREILLSRDQLTQWDRTLRQLEVAPGRAGRAALVETIVQGLSDTLSIDIDDARSPVDPSRNISIGEILQWRGAIPFGFNSRLLAYSRADLGTIVECEFQHIKRTAARRKNLLRIAETGTFLPEYREEAPDPNCRQMSAKGRAIPNLDPDIRQRALNPGTGENERSILFTQGAETFYWIPTRYMP